MKNATSILIVIACAATLFVACDDAPVETPAPPSLDLATLLAGADTSGYARAERMRAFRFPADHGPHPDFRTEWWYVTGNVSAANGSRFGFQLTFFRSALSPRVSAEASAWRSNQAWMAHFALTDVARGKHHQFERFSRQGNGLAGATARPFRVWLDDWHIEAAGPDGSVRLLRLSARSGEVSITLQLDALKPVVLQGEDGLSQKGGAPGNASYYYSLSRLRATGDVGVGQDSYAVTGDAWMDREWSTSALEENQVGWDWFALQFSDDTEMMYYQMRRADGTAAPQSRGVFIDADGRTRAVFPDDIVIESTGRWREYPSGWKIRTTDGALDVVVTPLLEDQELELSIRYWEGAVRVVGSRDGRAVEGYGFVELTGYAGR